MQTEIAGIVENALICSHVSFVFKFADEIGLSLHFSKRKFFSVIMFGTMFTLLIVGASLLGILDSLITQKLYLSR